MNEKKPTGPGYGALGELFKRDAVVRALMEAVEDVRIDIDDAMYSAEKLDAMLKRFLAYIDALPQPTMPAC